MARLRRRPDRGGRYEVDYTDVDGKRYRIDTGTRDEKLARLWLQKAEEQLSLARLGAVPKVGRLTKDVLAGRAQASDQPRLRLTELEENYLDRGKHDLELAERTLENIRFAFASFRGVLGDAFADSLADEDVRRWKRSLSDRGRAKNTVSIYQRALRTVFARGVKWKWIPANPFADVEVPSYRKAERPSKSMTREQVRSLLAAIGDERFALYVNVLLHTGARRGEILQLIAEDVDLERAVLTIRSRKTHRTLELPINRALQGIFHEAREKGYLPEEGYLFTTRSNRHKSRMGHPWNAASVSHAFKQAVRKAGLPETISLHSTRHTFVTLLRSKGVPQDIVQRLVGHTSPVTTDVYDASVALHFRTISDQITFDALEKGGTAS